MRHVAKKAGELPAAEEAIVSGVKLPKGARPVPSEAFLHPARAVKTSPLWVSASPVVGVGKLAESLVEKFPTTGLWPLVLETLRNAPTRPWLDAEIDPSGASDPAHHDARAVLAAWWANVIPGEGEDASVLAPFDRTFPGLAKAPEPPARSAIPSVLADLEGSLGLVAVTRPADAVAALGWLGPINHFNDMGMLASVLRSWEDRFGAHVVGIGFDTLTLAVDRPLADGTTANAVAAEHFAACMDAIYQGEGSINAYAETLIDADIWSFWWD